MKKNTIVQLVLGLLIANTVFAGPSKWSSHTVFNQAPLEVKLGTYTDDSHSDLLTMVLWNDGSMNRLDAVRVPSPYNGAGVTSTSLESTNVLFSLGDICRDNENIIVPYIKNFNVEIAVYTMSNWFTMSIPETISNDFDSADCAVGPNGVFVSTHDKDDSEIEIFKLNPNLSGFTFYGRFGGVGNNIAGPFDGGVRDTLVMQRDGPFSMSLYQASSGMIRTAQFDSSVSPPAFTHRDIEQEPAPTGFAFVKESYGARLRGYTVFGYNAASRAKAISINDSEPSNPTVRDLGQINNSGSQFNFQGGSTANYPGGLSRFDKIYAEWNKFYSYDRDSQTVEIDDDYPLEGVGGPVSNCRRELNEFESELFVAGPKVGSSGTDFHRIEISSPDTLFADGFESGDVSAWATCP